MGPVSRGLGDCPPGPVWGRAHTLALTLTTSFSGPARPPCPHRGLSRVTKEAWLKPAPLDSETCPLSE